MADGDECERGCVDGDVRHGQWGPDRTGENRKEVADVTAEIDACCCHDAAFAALQCCPLRPFIII